jgi:probable biosynthetic protein (TIGR04098 family)
MKRYLHIIQKEIPKIVEEELYIPISETLIDSLDLIVIRVALEKYFLIEIPDDIWFKNDRLADILEYFHNNQPNILTTEEITKLDIKISDNIEIRMPQMANNTLSENWLLKYLGDTHWQLLTKGFSKKSSDFIDDSGNRLYSTFLRINYNISPLNLFFENDIIEFVSSIKGFGSNSFISQIKGNVESKMIEANLITTFSTRENENNNQINKCETILNSNKINQLAQAPPFLNDYRLCHKSLLDCIHTHFGLFQFTDDSLFTCKYEINPYIDINGVGLLYFASYPLISDICFLKYYPDSIKFHTIYRDIFYFANCNSTDKILFQLNKIEEENNQIYIQVTLYRCSDNKKIARILTVKQKAE